jgi:hypothetical protein|tara:strand:+ start:63 stop:587 length:525 start_codon:yes stop_codon:yes gene_type:complete
MKTKRYLLAVICCLCGILNTSCGLFHPPSREAGYLTDHYYSCGPIALRDALDDYARKHGIVYKRAVYAKELSIEIQDKRRFFNLTEFLLLFDKQSASITWPDEIKSTLKARSIVIKEVSNIDELDPKLDIAIILVHKKGTLTFYHWLAYPRNSVTAVYGKDTVIDKIYILIPKS